ncbi:MAG: hypothetical protein JWQ07_4057 [Ramlibacter sp.]|nr:hypothetical protein [Ramlibacter sp.]
MSGRDQFIASSDEHALRRCALTLHALAADDKSWMMAKLSPLHRPEVERLLQELQALGIAPDRDVVRQALNTADHASVSSAAAPRATAVSGRGADECAFGMLADAQLGELAQLLQGEPAVAAAQVATMCRESDVPRVLAQLNASKRRQVQWMLGTSALSAASLSQAPKLREALRQEIAARLSVGTSSTPFSTPARESLSTRVRAFVRRWA